MSETWRAGIAIAMLGVGLALGGTTRYVWHRWGPRVHHFGLFAAGGALGLAVVFGALSTQTVGLTAAAVAAVALLWAAQNYARFWRDRRRAFDASAATLQRDVGNA